MYSDIITSLIILSVMLAALIGIGRLLEGHISALWKYRLDFLFFAVLTMPFVPCVKTVGTSAVTTQHTGASAALTDGIATAARAAEDIAVNRKVIPPEVLIIIWAVGAALVLTVFAAGSLNMKRLRDRAETADTKTAECFAECLKETGTSGRISLKVCGCVSPSLSGLFNAVILIPEREMSDEDMRHVILHELTHYKRKDTAVCLAACIFKAVYWFNPVVWLAFDTMKNDMEAACDEAVMCLTGNGAAYGRTVLRFAARQRGAAVQMGGGKRQIKRRIRAAADFKGIKKGAGIKGGILLAVLTALIVPWTPAVSVTAVERTAETAGENIDSEDMSRYFGEFDGSFVLYELNADKYTIYNEAESLKRVSPNSTWKTVCALAALEKGVITPENSTLEWDGTKYSIEAWNRDLNLYEAMQCSSNWYFERLYGADPEGVRETFKRLGFGNCDFSGDSFWAESSLKISAREQTEVLRKIYTNECGFSEENIQAVKNAVKISDGLYGKTGSGMVNGHRVNGWFAGFVEKDGEVYFFALNIRGKDNADGKLAEDTAIRILADRGIIGYEN